MGMGGWGGERDREGARESGDSCAQTAGHPEPWAQQCAPPASRGHCSRRPAVATGHWAFLNPHVKAECSGYKDPYVAQPSSG